MIDRGQSLLIKSYVFLAVMATLLLMSACSTEAPKKLTVKPVAKPVLLRPDLQVGYLQVIADRGNALVFWETINVLGVRRQAGVVSVKRDGQASLNMVMSETDGDFGPLDIGANILGKGTGDRFNVFSQENSTVKRRTFAVGKIGPRRQARLTAIGPPVTVIKLKGLAGTDPAGNLYFAAIRPAGKKKEQIVVSKTGADGRVIFRNRVIGVRNRLKSNSAGPIELVAGSDSFAAIWLTPKVRSHMYVRMLQQADAAGNLLGKAVELKDRDDLGMRVKSSEGRAVIGDIFAISGRRPHVFGRRVITWEQLRRLEATRRPLFTTLDATSNESLVGSVKDFIRPAGSDRYDPNYFGVGVKDRSGTELNAEISKAATDVARVVLTDTDPDQFIDFYRGGRLIKTLDLGRGEDISLAAAGNELIVAWTGGPGWVDLKLARWRLSEN